MLQKEELCKPNFYDLLENMPIGYQSLDKDAKFLEVNSALCAMLGYEKKELIGKSFRDLLHDTHLDSFDEEFSRVKQQGSYSGVEFSLFKKDGSIAYLSFDGKICYDDKGNFLHTHCIVKDNTGQKNSENSLRQSEELFKCLVDNSPNGILYCDTNGNILYVNPHLLGILGSPSLDETKKINLLNFPNLRAAGISAALEYSIEKKIVVRHECQYKSIWGKQSHLRFSITPIISDDGTIDRLMAIVEDVTESKIAEEKLKESEKKYRTIADYTSDWEYWIDNKLNFRYISPVCEQVTGYTTEEFINNPSLLIKIIHEEDKRIYINHNKAIVSKNLENCKLQFRIVTRDKKLKWIEHKCRPVFDIDGKNMGRRGTNTDITEMQEALEKVRINQSNYFNIFEGVSDGLIYVKKNGFVQDVNASFVRITGIDRRNLINRHAVVLAREFVTKDMLKTVMAVIANNLNGKAMLPFELEFRGKILHISTKTGINEEGVIGVLRDVTELRNAENLLKESEKKFRKVLENVQLLAIMLDLEGRITFCNDCFLDHTGYKREEILGERWIKTFIPIQRREEVKKAFDNALKGDGKPYQLESELVTESGDNLIILWKNTIIRDSKDLITGITAIGTDVTDLREKELIDKYHIDISRKLQTTESTKEVFDTCLNAVLEITEYESGAVYLIEDDKFLMQHHIGCSQKFVEAVSILPITPVMEEFLSRGSDIIIPTEEESAPFKYLFEQEGLISGAIIPFIHLGEKIGSFTIASRRLNEINPIRIKILKSTLDIIQYRIHKALAEENIFQSRNRYRSVVRVLSEGIIVFDKDGNPVTVNDSACSILGLSEKQIMSLSIFDGLPEIFWEDRTLVAKEEHPVIKTLRSGKQQNRVIIGFKTPDGDEKWLSTNTQPVFDTNDDLPSSVVVSFTDITTKVKAERELTKYRFHLEELVRNRTVKLEEEIKERKKVENALRESETKYRLLTENAHDVIFRYVYKPEAGYEYISPACIELTGYTPDEFYSDPNLKSKVIHPEDRFMIDPFHLKNLKPGESIEMRLIHKDGSLKWIEESLRLFWNDSNEIIAREGILRDINIRKSSEIRIQQALIKEKDLSRLKSKFISTVSHEFKTPLTTILSSVELMKRYIDLERENEIDLHLEQVINIIGHLSGLLDDILLVSNADSYEISFKPVHTNLRKLCERLISEYEKSVSTNHQINYVYNTNEDFYLLDSNLIRIILMNLISNAVKFSPDGGEIDVTINENDFIELCISDSGIGIPMEDKLMISDPFYRSNNVNGIPGSGLGLSLVKRAVDMHNGKFELFSDLGKGTKVVVKIPVM